METNSTNTTAPATEAAAIELLEKVIDRGLVETVGDDPRQLSMTCEWDSTNALRATVWDEDADATEVGTFLIVIKAVSR